MSAGDRGVGRLNKDKRGDEHGKKRGQEPRDALGGQPLNKVDPGTFFPEKKLPVQIGELDRVQVDEVYILHSGQGQILQYLTPQPSSPHDKHARLRWYEVRRKGEGERKGGREEGREEGEGGRKNLNQDAWGGQQQYHFSHNCVTKGPHLY